MWGCTRVLAHTYRALALLVLPPPIPSYSLLGFRATPQPPFKGGLLFGLGCVRSPQPLGTACSDPVQLPNPAPGERCAIEPQGSRHLARSAGAKRIKEISENLGKSRKIPEISENLGESREISENL